GGGGRVAVLVDDVDELERIQSARVASGGGSVRVCIDVDAGWPILGGRMRVGVKRSPVHAPAQAAALAREVVTREGLELVGIMAYEAQIAGLGDAPPGQPLPAAAIRWMQRRSAREPARRRAQLVAAVEAVAVQAGAPLEFVNGGGTGS